MRNDELRFCEFLKKKKNFELKQTSRKMKENENILWSLHVDVSADTRPSVITGCKPGHDIEALSKVKVIVMTSILVSKFFND